MRDLVQRLFDHMFWADRRILDLLAASDSARTADVLRLASHLLAAERVWLLRIEGRDSAAQPIWPEWTLDELEHAAEANRAGYERLLERLAEEDLERVVEYTNSKGTPFRTRTADILTHVAMHGSYHRGQIAAAIRRAGAEPVNTDYITFIRDVG
ncbi:MAG TPA: DinB family protein [Longimicrobiales bacterium]